MAIKVDDHFKGKDAIAFLELYPDVSESLRFSETQDTSFYKKMPDGRIIEVSVLTKTVEAAAAIRCSLEDLPYVTILAIHASTKTLLERYKRGEETFKRAYPSIDFDLASDQRDAARLVDTRHPLHGKIFSWQEAADFLATHQHEQIAFTPPVADALPVSEYELRYYQLNDGSIVSALTYYKGETDADGRPRAQVNIQHTFASFEDMRQFWDEMTTLNRHNLGLRE